MLGRRFCDSSKQLKRYEYLYDFASHHQSDWPCSSIKFGGQLIDGDGVWTELLYLGCRGEGAFNFEEEAWEGEPSLLVVATLEIPKYGFQLENFRPQVRVAKVFKHPGEINSLAVWPKMPFFVASATDSNAVFLWDLRNHDEEKRSHYSLPEPPDLVLAGAGDLIDFAVSFFNDGPLVCAGSKDATVYVWNFASYQQRSAGGGGWRSDDSAESPLMSKISRNLCNYLNDPVNTMVEPALRLKGHTGAVEDVKFSPTMADLLVSVGVDRRLNFWNSNESLKPICSVEDAHAHDINSVDWSPLDKHLVATASHDCSVKIWDTRTYACVERIPTVGPVHSVKFSPTQPGVLAYNAKHLVVRDLPKQRDVLLHKGHESRVTDFDWSAHDKMTLCSISDEAEFGEDSEIAGGAIQIFRPLGLLWDERASIDFN